MTEKQAAETPLTYVRMNQWGIVLTVVASIVFQWPILIYALWAVQIVGLVMGMRGNLFVQVLRRLIRKTSAETEALELQRFNNTLAVVMLTLAVTFTAIGWETAGYVMAALVAAAAFIAICGYCIGCALYFQLKKYRNHNA